MSRCMCCTSKYECGCTDIQQSVIDLANIEQVVDMQKLEIELLKEENARLREALEFYANENNYSKWGYMRINGDDYFDCDKEYLGNDGNKDNWDIRGGKRARKALGGEE